VKILVFLQEASDTRVVVPRSGATGRAREEWLAFRLPEDGRAALALGLELRCAAPPGWLVVAALGSRRQDEILKTACAWGADEAVRLWEPSWPSPGEAGQALVVAAAAHALSCDLVAFGVTNRQGDLSALPGLVAEELCVPYVHGIEQAEVGDTGELVVGRVREGGFREELALSLPAVLSVRPALNARPECPEPLLATRLAAEATRVPVLDLAELGVPAGSLREREARLAFGRLVGARPALLPNPAPDSCLPAFDRIQALVHGVVRSREGRVARGTPEGLAGLLFARLKEGGWLDAVGESQASGEETSPV